MVMGELYAEEEVEFTVLPPTPPGKASLLVEVRDAVTHAPLPGTEVTADTNRVVTDERGVAVLILDPGTYTVTVRRPHYLEYRTSVTLREGETRYLPVVLVHVAVPAGAGAVAAVLGAVTYYLGHEWGWW